MARLFAGRGIRLGAYGDPAAVPAQVWQNVATHAAFWTGYTHQWRTCDPIYARWCMASCVTEDERRAAKALGYRTFRATMNNAFDEKLPGEVVCPASIEAGKRSTCEQCRLGAGLEGYRPTDVVITMHGMVINRIRRQAAKVMPPASCS